MRNFVIAAAMAAMVCVLGCDKLNTQGPQGFPGPKGEKGDKGDPGVGVAEIGQDCQTNADCGEAGKCTTGKFCALTSGDDIIASVRKRREADIEEAEETLRKAGEALDNAHTICSDTSGDCKVVDEAKRHVESADKRLHRAQDRLALVTPVTAPTTEPPKAEAVAKADDKASAKKDEKPADKPKGTKKPVAAEPSATASAKADPVEDLKTSVGLLTGRVDDIEGRVGGIADNQKTLFGKTKELVVAVGDLGKKIEAKPGATPIEPSGDRIFNYRRFNACVKAREMDTFVGEGLTDKERKTKIENDCRAHEAG